MVVLAAVAMIVPLRARGNPVPEWRNVGPANAGGRVTAVAGSDRDPYLYYFGGAGGGVFRTTDGGLRWESVWNKPGAGAIGAIAIAPSNSQIVWVGTGESNPRNDTSGGDGLWQSVDGGGHWVWRGLPDSYAISKILIDPRDPNRIVAGILGNTFRDSTQRGVYRSTDGGRTWRRTLYIGPQSGVSDLAFDFRDFSVMYAGIWEVRRSPWTLTSGGVHDGLFKSVDGGATWHKLRGHGLPPGLMGRIGVAVSPSDPNYVYALIQSKSGLLWRSTDAGATWKLISRDTLVDQRPFYMSRLAVDPRNSNRVLFASENLVESTNGGRTLRDIAGAVHQDHHDFWISRDGRRIIEANDGGAPISVDGGETWDWRFNVVLGQAYHVGYDDENPYHVCAAFQDGDSFCGPSQSLSPLGITASDWRDVANDGDGVWVWPQPGDPDSVWNVGINEINGQLGIYQMRTRQNYDVSPYVADTNGRALAGMPYRFNWEAPIAFSVSTPMRAYFGANVLFASDDLGRTWHAMSPDLTRNDPSKQQVSGGPINPDVSGAEFYDTLLDIAPSPIDPKVIWVGTDDGLVQRTSDGGAHWANVTPSAVEPWVRVDAVEPSRVAVSRAYAVIDRHIFGDPAPHIFETDDAGKTWRPISAGLPQSEYAHVVREDPVNANVLYAGLEEGVWMSLDRGSHWESLRGAMPAVSIHDLRVQPRDRDLIAGTHGLGIWILDDLTPIEGLAQARASPVPTLFAPRPAYTWYQWWSDEYGTHENECCPASGVFSGDNPPYGALISYYLPRAVPGKVRIEIVNALGETIRSLAASSASGLHREAWDLAEEPPVPWLSARSWNRGPDDGPLVVPGTYFARLRAGAQVAQQPIEVRADPRAQWTQPQYVARHNFISALDQELSSVDMALNTLDQLRRRENAAARKQIDEVYAQLTSGGVNSEDDVLVADRLRERLTILQGTVSLSQGPPLPPHLREAAAIRGQYDIAMAAYQHFLASYTPSREKSK